MDSQKEIWRDVKRYVGILSATERIGWIWILKNRISARNRGVINATSIGQV